MFSSYIKCGVAAIAPIQLFCDTDNCDYNDVDNHNERTKEDGSDDIREGRICMIARFVSSQSKVLLTINTPPFRLKSSASSSSPPTLKYSKQKGS